MPLRSHFILCAACLSLTVVVQSSLVAQPRLTVGRGVIPRGGVGEVPLFASSESIIHGVVMILDWDTSRLEGIEIVANDGAGSPLADVQLILPIVKDAFMALVIISDTDGDDCEFINPGQMIEVGRARFRCIGDCQSVPVRLVDGVHRLTPENAPLFNAMIQNFRLVTAKEELILEDGSIGEGAAGEVDIACGGELDESGLPGPVRAQLNESATVSFYYRAPGEGIGDLRDQIQGVSLAVSFDCSLTGDRDSLDVSAGALGEVDAEFVHLEMDNAGKATDGDGCEMTLGVLVDSLPPFDGRTLPATDTFRELFRVDFQVGAGAPCGECVSLDFVDGLNGNGDVPVKNRVAINFQPVIPTTTTCDICIDGIAEFIRGDCNFSVEPGGAAVNIADAASIVGFVFQEGKRRFPAPCEDACDANDDGNLDAADIVFLLEYLFIPDSPPPPDPGPVSPGIDPTEDDLGCNGDLFRCE